MQPFLFWSTSVAQSRDCLARVWVGERTLGRLVRPRRLARDYETLPASSEALALWSMTVLMARRLGRHQARRVTLPPAAT